ncbi:MAG: PHP domain-containing protein, partial [Patescibacteria group bacterium]
MSFVHLHTHSHYSLLDGLGNVPDLVAAAKKRKMPALALTDHGVLYGAIEFYQECLEHGVKPIIGIEAYLTDGSMTDQDRSIKPYHLILLATSTVGYHNLIFL